MGKSNNSDFGDLKAFLGEGTEFKGTLSFSGTVRVDGVFEGEIISDDTLIVGETAVINADISVGTLIAKGQIRGNVSATIKIDIRTDSKVIGNVKTSVLVIEEGALFDGHCEMIPKESSKKSANNGSNSYQTTDSNDQLVEEEEESSILL